MTFIVPLPYIDNECYLRIQSDHRKEGDAAMPIYEYVCETCGRFEQFQKMSDEPLKTCPKCGAPVRRVIGSSVNIIFKGSGFYTTDNRSKEYTEKAKSESKAASE